MTEQQQKKHRVTLIPGDGIGPEVAAAARKVLEASGAPLEWVEVRAGQEVMEEYGTPLPDYVLDSIRQTRVALKGPVTTPIGEGFRSVNVGLRQGLDLYANVRPCRTWRGIPTRYDQVDLVIFRENTEDLYAGIEHRIGDYGAESIKLITRPASERIARRAFEFARKNGRKKVTIVHKANIMKYSDGLFLSVCRDVAAEYPEIQSEDVIIDALCMHLVTHPENFDVLLLPNLYGDIVSDLCAGLVGGLGVAPGANMGNEMAVFEAVHGSAPTIAGQNKANPTAMILSGVMLLRHLGEHEAAGRVEAGIARVLKEARTVTGDLGGTAGTREMAEAIVEAMHKD